MVPKYMFRASYTLEGLSGAVQEGFASREQFVTGLIAGVGGTLEAFYFAYGEDDVIGIMDASQEAMIALSLAVNSSGGVKLTTTPLLTAGEMDAAREHLPDYRAPGA